MKIFSTMKEDGHEQVVIGSQPDIGLRTIIAIHDTTLGPALGGCRIWPYESEEEALTDVLRLSRAMTYKASAAGLNLGGGKAVIIADPKQQKSEALFRAFGRFVQSLNGRYITAEDVGTDVTDMEWIRMETKHVVGLNTDRGGSGDPSPVTALGVLHGIEASLQNAGRTGDLFKGLRVAIQGLGHCGSHLAQLLHQRGAQLVVTDLNEELTEAARVDFDAEVVAPTDILAADVDVFAPCAMGAVINPESIDVIKAPIIAGSANNQLATPDMGHELEKRGKIYAPDFVLNAGGLINVSFELWGYNRERALRRTRNIYYQMRKVYKIARENGMPTHEAAMQMAVERIDMIRKISRSYRNP